jgi:hypothetical protein
MQGGASLFLRDPKTGPTHHQDYADARWTHQEYGAVPLVGDVTQPEILKNSMQHDHLVWHRWK